MSAETTPDEKRMRLRYSGKCRACGVELPAKVEAVYERATKTVRCLKCAPAPSQDPTASTTAPVPGRVVEAEEPVEAGTPGASARREFERRRADREDRIRTKHPKLGRLILALSDDPQSTRAWDVGAGGEERLGKRLNEFASASLQVLHDRRIPGSRANIDHIAVAATGVYVIDAKKYKGRPGLRVEGGLLRPRVEKLVVGSRDCSKLVDGVLNQLEVVRDVVGEGVPVHGVLCFVEADWPLIGGSFRTRGVDVLRPKKLYPKLTSNGSLGVEMIERLHRALVAALPRA